MGGVGEVEGTFAVMVRLVRVRGVRDDLDGLGALLAGEQLLQADQTGEHERDLANNERLEGEHRDRTQHQWHQRHRFQLQR